jgi:Ser/Thr protein kinase RdoA (MazF antagonist)
MMSAVYTEALAAANIQDDPLVIPITNGLINQTYKVTLRGSGNNFLLQQINTRVFRQPEDLQSNYETIWSWLEKKKNRGENVISIPRPLRFSGDNRFFRDTHNRYWRIVEFIEGTRTIPVAADPEQARKVAETFGRFTASFETFDNSSLAITIPGFHDLSLRYRQFQSSLHSRDYERLLSAAPLIGELKKREHYASFYEVMTGSDAFKQRVMHHDAKISNILFDAETGGVVCPVDLDTCMPGYFFSDLGDMIRSMAASEDETSTRFDAIHIREDFYKALLEGYLDKMDEHLTGTEKKYIHHSGILIIYMQALRFLADFLNGDSYYRISYPAQNHDRAKNQLVLLQQLEIFLRQHYGVTV